MEQSVDPIEVPLTSFRPRTGTMEAWNAAYVRVEDYLRAHRIHNRLHQSRLIQVVLERAAKRHEADPSIEPTTLAAQEMDALMDEWFAHVIKIDPEMTKDRVAIAGRVALLLADGMQKWPYSFMDTTNVPDDFRKSLQTSSMVAGPNMNVSSMVPREIDLGVISEAAGETLERFEKWPLLRTLFLWGLFAASLAGIFYITR
ncbi:hypothetical protein [Nibricoccus sp. IMCC34717]|uniref:hypothetical protein n=1 Tax=Nibricoccus sp. IMCC34717 TaxID=3034021 RepID=UPI00384E68B4